jgi:hypothetical protein
MSSRDPAQPTSSDATISAVDVPACLGGRKNGATTAEIRRVTRTLERLAPAAAAAIARRADGATTQAEFARLLEALADE